MHIVCFLCSIKMSFSWIFQCDPKTLLLDMQDLYKVYLSKVDLVSNAEYTHHVNRAEQVQSIIYEQK